jgi:hypothetical protein
VVVDCGGSCGLVWGWTELVRELYCGSVHYRPILPDYFKELLGDIYRGFLR